MSFTEAALIDFLSQRARRRPEVEVGIGHDAAVVRSPSGDGLALKSDQTIEGVHFTRGEAPIEQIGRKALARVLSDLGAIGARPIAALCSAALPGDLDEGDAHALFDGLLALADELDVSLVGGDLARAPSSSAHAGAIALDVAALGFMEGRAPMRRDGARVGDALAVTGPLGGSREGHHLRFAPRVREGIALAASGLVHACIDLSDGLARDLRQIARASNVGARLELPALPRRELRGGPASVEQALHDGEDYELLFAAPPGALAELSKQPAFARMALVRVGAVVDASAGVTQVDARGAVTPLASGGFEHRFGA